jgi:hypothetical protein
MSLLGLKDVTNARYRVEWEGVFESDEAGLLELVKLAYKRSRRTTSGSRRSRQHDLYTYKILRDLLCSLSPKGADLYFDYVKEVEQ